MLNPDFSISKFLILNIILLTYDHFRKLRIKSSLMIEGDEFETKLNSMLKFMVTLFYEYFHHFTVENDEFWLCCLTQSFRLTSQFCIFWDVISICNIYLKMLNPGFNILNIFSILDADNLASQLSISNGTYDATWL